MQQLIRDPQLYWDGLGIAIATVTVLPSAALPLLGLAAGIYLTLQPGLAAWGAASIVAGLAIAPFAWRVLGPVAAASSARRRRSRIEQLTEIQADVTKAQAVELERIEREPARRRPGPDRRAWPVHGGRRAPPRHRSRSGPGDHRRGPRVLGRRRWPSCGLLARGINPPVLSERGLVDAVRALALDAPVPVAVRSSLPSRPERPVESAVYFAVSELLVNVAKHAHATQAGIDLGYDGKTLTATVTDNGAGGAAGSRQRVPGSGLNGIERRLAAFGGRVEIDSPAGGPTRITLAVPCVLS